MPAAKEPASRYGNIADRLQEVDDRAVPGDWEGDLMIGKRNATAIGTLVERSTGYAMLVSLPDGYKPEHVAPAQTAKVRNAARLGAPPADLGPRGPTVSLRQGE